MAQRQAGRQRTLVVKRGEIWLVSLDRSAGHEQRGTRPVQIVSPAAFNKLTGMSVVLPVARGERFARRQGFAVALEKAGTRTHGVIRCDQPRTLDLAANQGRRLEAVATTIMADALARLTTILE